MKNVQSYDQIRRERDKMRQLTLSNVASPFGCCNFFDRCNGEIMSLHYGGQLPLLDWMGFDVSEDCEEVVEFITYVRPEFSGQTPSVGHLSNACATPNSYEFGSAKVSVNDFGRYGRSGPTRDIMKPKRFCKTDPIRRLDGEVVEDEREWDARFATDVMLQDISRDLIIGNAATPGMFDGLEQWVRTGYPGDNGEFLDSWVVNWNSNPMSGGAGITINGDAIAATFNFVDVLKSIVRRIRMRISWARQLMNQQLNLADLILLMPSTMAECLLDFFTCWSVCEGTEFNIVNLQQREARTFRDGLVSESPNNVWGHGYITIDGMIIPILGYDWELQKSPSIGDVYLLTGAIGSVRVWSGQHLSADEAAADHGDEGYFSLDGGRILGTTTLENECRKLKLWMHPRLFCRAPWAQIRFQDVQCVTPAGPLSPDPLETSFYPQSSFDPAIC